MTEKKRSVDASAPATSSTAPPIGEEELQWRIAVFRARGFSRVAGPDDPIYRDGLRMTGVRRPKETAEDS